MSIKGRPQKDVHVCECHRREFMNAKSKGNHESTTRKSHPELFNKNQEMAPPINKNVTFRNYISIVGSHLCLHLT